MCWLVINVGEVKFLRGLAVEYASLLFDNGFLVSFFLSFEYFM